jgi:hypothetical protein
LAGPPGLRVFPYPLFARRTRDNRDRPTRASAADPRVRPMGVTPSAAKCKERNRLAGTSRRAGTYFREGRLPGGIDGFARKRSVCHWFTRHWFTHWFTHVVALLTKVQHQDAALPCGGPGTGPPVVSPGCLAVFACGATSSARSVAVAWRCGQTAVRMRLKKPKPLSGEMRARPVSRLPSVVAGFPDFWRPAHDRFPRFYRAATDVVSLVNQVISAPLRGRLQIVLGFMTGILQFIRGADHSDIERLRS